MVSLRSGKKISRQEGRSSLGREDHNKMSKSQENVANPRYSRTSSGEGDSSFQFPFFDQTTCELMTPPPTNGKRGTRKAASVNDDDSGDLIHFDLPIDISPIAPSRESDADGHLMCMLSEDPIGGTPANFLLEAAASSHSDAPDEQLLTYTAVKSGVNDDFETDLVSGIVDEEKSRNTANIPNARPSLAANELFSSVDESSDLDDAPFSPGAPLNTFSNMHTALKKLKTNVLLHEPAIGNNSSDVEEQNVSTEKAPEPLDSAASPENTPNTPKEESDDVVTEVQESNVSVEETSDPLDPDSPDHTPITPNEECSDAVTELHHLDVTELHHLDRDLSSARKRIDETSNEFIERIRSAAHKRKVAMTRSRDSLAAKEQEQKLSIAESKLKAENARAQEAEKTRPIKTQRRESELVVLNKQFKARPLPVTTGEKGTGGLVGVPKVESKPTTTPFSPLLGSRRRGNFKTKALEKPKPPSVKKDAEIPKSSRQQAQAVSKRRATLLVTLPSNAPAAFRARPVPASTGLKGHGGQLGVPKVQKRPVTVPSSPSLGPRRRATSAGRIRPPGNSSSEPHPENVNQTNLKSILKDRTSTESIKRKKLSLSSQPSLSKTTSFASLSSPLMGLHLLETTPLPLNMREQRIGRILRRATLKYLPMCRIAL
jgi:hypothetical protein